MRTIKVPAVVTLAVLNEAMLVCFGWLGEHLHEFTIRAVGYSTDWAVDADDSETVTLDSLELRAGERFCWAYDFFANWNVDIRVEAATVANRGSDLWMSGPPHHGLGIVMLKPVPPPGGRWNHGGREGSKHSAASEPPPICNGLVQQLVGLGPAARSSIASANQRCAGDGSSGSDALIHCWPPRCSADF